jgi:uncharacterized protein YqjF (DUF2071 family)
MIATAPPIIATGAPSLLSARAREAFLAAEGAPLFHADWLRTVFIHFAVEPARLQPFVPFELDLLEGEAYVSLVAFSLERMRLGPLPESLCRWLLRAVSPCRFLNVRTYVREGGRDGIFFLAEWLSNHWSVPLGPPMYGVPYRAGELGYGTLRGGAEVRGRVTSRAGNALLYTGERDAEAALETAQGGTREEFLLERYTAFTEYRGAKRLFRVWHPPWPHAPLALELQCASLLTETGDWCAAARFAGAHYSPGFPGVWMGRPRRLRGA